MTPNFVVWLPMTFVTLSDQAYTKPAHAPGYGPPSSVDSPVMRMVGILPLASFVPGKRKGKFSPYVARSQTAPHAGSRSIVPVPSELNANVNSFSSVDDRTLFQLAEAILFGRDHAHCTRSVPLTNGSLNVHGVLPTRAEKRWLDAGT